MTKVTQEVAGPRIKPRPTDWEVTHTATKLDHAASDFSCLSPARNVPVGSKWGSKDVIFMQ